MANAEVAEDAEHPDTKALTGAEAQDEGGEVGGAIDLESAPEPAEARGGAPIDAPTPALKRSRRILLALTLPVAGIVLLTPVVVASVAVVAAAIIDVVAALTVARLAWEFHLLQAEQAMNVIFTASRLGFLALGYLGLFAALIALANGLLGRGRGRLFIIPGMILTGAALVLFATSVFVATPLLTALHLPHRVLAALALVFAVDAVAIATFLADTRDTRRRRMKMSKTRRPMRHTQPPN